MPGLAAELQKTGEVSLPQQLQAHGLWLATDGEQGTRLDLSGQTLSKHKFEGLNLRSAILQKADLRECRFRGTNLEDAELAGADLSQCDFRECELHRASLQDTNLHETTFRNANLGDADLTGATFLLPGQLAGANLAGTKLPDSISDFSAIRTVDERSKMAQTLLLSLIAACSYSWLTVGSTTDLSLVGNVVTSELPVIGTQIPIVWFYRLAPLLLTVFFLHFLLYAQRLWEALASLPAVFPDGVPVDQRVYPWFLIGLTRAHFVRLDGGPAFFRLQLLVSVMLAFWATPITVALLWGRYLTRQDWAGTMFHCLTLGGCIWAACAFAYSCAKTLSGDSRRKRGRAGDEACFHKFSPRLPVVLTAVFLILSYGSIAGVRPTQEPHFAAHLLPTRWVPRLFLVFGYSPFAEIDGAELSKKPPDWKEELANAAASEPAAGVASPADSWEESASSDKLREDWQAQLEHTRAQLEPVVAARLNGVHLRHASAVEAFLVKAEMRQADLTAANLYRADLRLLNTVAPFNKEPNTVLRSAILVEANLTGADLVQGNLEEADLSYAVASGADLEAAILNGANLTSATLDHTILHGAHLVSANLEDANLQNANLSFADLTNARLVAAQLQGANLESASLQGADIQLANLEGAIVTVEQVLQTKNWRHAVLSRQLLDRIQKHESSQ